MSPVPGTPVVSIVGRSGSGKTTLLEKLIPELRQRGYRLAVIKHHYHAGFQFDVPGKDSWRYAQAGADQVLVAAPGRVIHIRHYTYEPALSEVLDSIRDVDLIITEGFKRADTPKIELIRSTFNPEPVLAPEQWVAVVSDLHFDTAVPQFGLDDVAGLADFIQQAFLEKPRPALSNQG